METFILGLFGIVIGLVLGIIVGAVITLSLLRTCESAAQALYWNVKQADDEDDSEAWKES